RSGREIPGAHVAPVARGVACGARARWVRGAREPWTAEARLDGASGARMAERAGLTRALRAASGVDPTSGATLDPVPRSVRWPRNRVISRRLGEHWPERRALRSLRLRPFARASAVRLELDQRRARGHHVARPRADELHATI